MSLILDALNRSRTESEPVPGLASPPVYLEETPSPVKRWLPWVALVIALLLVAWLVWDRNSETSGVAVDVEPRPGKTVESVSDPRSAQVADVSLPPPSATPQPATPQPATPQPAAPQPAAPQPAAPQPTKARQAAPPEPAVNAAVARLYQDTPAPQKTKRPAVKKPASSNRQEASIAAGRAASTPAPDVEKMLELARREKKSVELEEHPAPFVSALSQSTKDAIPTLLYERHDYNSEPGRSLVVINGKSLRAGANVGSGVKVEEILKDSVVLKHRDTQFRLRALNSWVNL